MAVLRAGRGFRFHRFPWISEDFGAPPNISKHVQKFPNVPRHFQPFPNIHGFYSKKLSKEPQHKDPYLEKYDLLKDTKHIFDISNALDNNIANSFSDPKHYSPESNKLIAKSIYDITNNKINEYVK